MDVPEIITGIEGLSLADTITVAAYVSGSLISKLDLILTVTRDFRHSLTKAYTQNQP